MVISLYNHNFDDQWMAFDFRLHNFDMVPLMLAANVVNFSPARHYESHPNIHHHHLRHYYCWCIDFDHHYHWQRCSDSVSVFPVNKQWLLHVELALDFDMPSRLWYVAQPVNFDYQFDSAYHHYYHRNLGLFHNCNMTIKIVATENEIQKRERENCLTRNCIITVENLVNYQVE